MIPLYAEDARQVVMANVGATPRTVHIVDIEPQLWRLMQHAVVADGIHTMPALCGYEPIQTWRNIWDRDRGERALIGVMVEIVECEPCASRFLEELGRDDNRATTA